MILESDCGIGIEGKEGMQASLASDFSIKEFCQLKKLVLWHGRLSYRRSAVLSQFVFHRGLIISVIQALFTILFYFVTIPIYNGFLMLGYATIYTALPVFSLVFDKDADVESVLNFPPLYKTLQKGRALSLKTFSVWVWKSVYQVSILFSLGLTLFDLGKYNFAVGASRLQRLICEYCDDYIHSLDPDRVVECVHPNCQLQHDYGNVATLYGSHLLHVNHPHEVLLRNQLHG